MWKFNKKSNDKIKLISGNKLYELVTGKPDALKQVYRAIPKAISELKGDDLSGDDKKVIDRFGEYIFLNR